jgi:hypothetical protein
LSLPGELLCFDNIFILRFLGASDEEKHQKAFDRHEVDAVSRTIINAQLAYATTYGLHVAEVAEREAADTNLDAGPSLFIAKFAQPGCEEVGLTDLDYALTIVHIIAFFQGRSFFDP